MDTIFYEIVRSISKEPRDLKTIPLRRDGIWFYVYAVDGVIYVEGAKNHKPSSRISKTRRLTLSEFKRIYPIYLRRAKGEAVSKEAMDATRNQVYWYSIIKNCSVRNESEKA